MNFGSFYRFDWVQKNVRYWPKADIEFGGSWRPSIRLLNFYCDEKSGD
jgi:hypothetical protein